MSKSAFAKTIINKMKSAIGTDGQSFSSGSASAAMAAVAQGITEYLTQNTKVMVKYTGIIPGTPPTPDPTQADTFKIVGVCAPPSQSNSFDAWLMQIQMNIISGFMLAPAGNAQVVFPQKPFLVPGVKITQANLKSAHDVNDKDPQQKIWEIICDGIMQWINTSAMNPAPSAATHPTAGSAGMANITKITLT
jgi:hypothetical protein